MKNNELVFLKKEHPLYGNEGRAIKKELYNDLPKEHKKLFVTERTYKNNLLKKRKDGEITWVYDHIQHMEDIVTVDEFL